MEIANKIKIILGVIMIFTVIFIMVDSAKADIDTSLDVTFDEDSENSNNIIPGETASGGIVPCGRGGQLMCTLCDLIRGFNIIIQYIMKIAIGGALLAIAIGGILYTISAGESAAMEMAKSTIKNAVIGFIIIFSAWLIVNTTIEYIGTKSDLGIGVTSWGEFECNAKK